MCARKFFCKNNDLTRARTGLLSQKASSFPFLHSPRERAETAITSQHTHNLTYACSHDDIINLRTAAAKERKEGIKPHLHVCGLAYAATQCNPSLSILSPKANPDIVEGLGRVEKPPRLCASDSEISVLRTYLQRRMGTLALQRLDTRARQQIEE